MNNSKSYLCYLVLFFVGFNASFFAAGLRLEPLPATTIWEKTSELETAEQVIDAFLLSSATPSDKIDAYKAKLLSYVAGLKPFLSNTEENVPISEIVLHYMFDSGILKRYVLTASTADDIIESGRYNCVSSAVLYVILTSSLNIKTKGVITHDHAFVNVSSSIGDIDVETTNRYGFNPGVKQEFTDLFSSQTGFSYVAPGNYSDRRFSNKKELVGLVFENRMVGMNYVDAVGIAVDNATYNPISRVVLLRDQAFRNLLAEYNNTAHYSEGMLAYQNILALYPSADLDKSFDALINNQINSFLKDKQYDLAKTQLNDAVVKKYTSPLVLLDLKRIANLNSLLAELQNPNNDFQTSEKLLNTARQNKIIEQDKYNDYYTVILIKEVQRLSRLKEYQGAYDFVQSLPPEVKALPKLASVEKNTVNNLAAMYYNEFTVLANQQNFTAANAVLVEGLAILPNNKLLLQGQAKIQAYLE